MTVYSAANRFLLSVHGHPHYEALRFSRPLLLQIFWSANWQK